jgi:hypothetical protein
MICRNKKCNKGIFEKRANSKDIVFYNSYFCSKDCVSDYIDNHPNKIIETAKLAVKKNYLEQKREIIDYKKKLQEKVQQIARLIDHDLPCLARVIHGQMHGGHIFSKGSSPNMRFNLHNIHRQSAQSNHWQNDDALLREGLKNEYGEDYFEFIVSLRKTPKSNLSNKDYQEAYKIACKIAVSLRNNASSFPYSKKERLELRNDINKSLGIYPDAYSIYQNL